MGEPGARGRYAARSASDRTDDWPFWYVADTARGGLNVTVELLPEMRGYLPFVTREVAGRLALSQEKNDD